VVEEERKRMIMMEKRVVEEERKRMIMMEKRVAGEEKKKGMIMMEKKAVEKGERVGTMRVIPKGVAGREGRVVARRAMMKKCPHLHRHHPPF